MFFAFARRIKHALLSDTNEELVLAYQVVKSDVEALIEQLRLHKRKHEKRAGQTYEDGKTYYRRVRDAEPSDPVEIAARFIYLNKTCYNGLYRVNSKGKFNVPRAGRPLVGDGGPVRPRPRWRGSGCGFGQVPASSCSAAVGGDFGGARGRVAG